MSNGKAPDEILELVNELERVEEIMLGYRSCKLSNEYSSMVISHIFCLASAYVIRTHLPPTPESVAVVLRSVIADFDSGKDMLFAGFTEDSYVKTLMPFQEELSKLPTAAQSAFHQSALACVEYLLLNEEMLYE